MKVARIMFTILNFTPNSDISPSIHIQLIIIGKKAITASLRLPNEAHKNRNTIMEHTTPI